MAEHAYGRQGISACPVTPTIAMGGFEKRQELLESHIRSFHG